MTVKTEEPAVYVPGNSIASAPQEADVYIPGALAQEVTQYSQPQQPQIVYAQPMQQEPPKQQPNMAVIPAAGPLATPVATPAVISPVNMGGLGKDPVRITCPYCQQTAVTRTSNTIDACTVVSVIVLLIVFWPIFWIPFLGNCCKTTNHHCGHCHRKVGQTSAC
mmetsp:Transcript_3849/g.7655  ORF Transcript_3849/g.7655 Transcript_3849/m.7655 type:complete len:164 (+) Transcript_3849:81-572(+)